MELRPHFGRLIDPGSTPLVAIGPATRHHTIISGTGRAGTTFLVKLLTNLGLDTGYSLWDLHVWANCNAGLERDLRAEDAPYIVKSPWICDTIDEVAADPRIVIDYAIIPMRTLEAAAESRRYVERTSDRDQFEGPGGLPGGLWHTDDPARQEGVLARQFHKLMVGLAKTEARIILLHYPRLTHDPVYLAEKLAPLVGDRPFLDVFRKTVDPTLVHQFTADDRP